MKKIYILLTSIGFVFGLLYTPDVAAGDEATIVVTGSRISRSDLYDMPAVTITRNASHLTQSIEIVDDSRSPELRKREIIQTISNILKMAAKEKGFSVAYGSGFLTPVTITDDSLPILESRKTHDTSYIHLHIKYAFSDKVSTKKQVARLRNFVRKINPVGRAEVESKGDIGLSIKDPEQFRYEILSAIVEENKKLKALSGGDCEISVSGLERRVEWARAAIDKLMMYIGYATEITCK